MPNENRYRLFHTELQRDEKSNKLAFTIIALLIILILVDVVYLNILIFKSQSGANQTAIQTTANSVPPSPTPPSTTDTPMPTQVVQSIPPTLLPVFTNPAAAKDYFIPLGSGDNQTSDWTDVPGVQAMVDFGTYPNIQQIRFEASVSVPTANQSVSVRLFNVTDKHPVWNSEVLMQGNASAYLTSSAIIYDKGAKVYQVQMKTQLQYPATLTQARIHITLQ